ncbi:hypothetical protein, partial [Oharaeibacter diazotrophicus]
MADGVNRTKAKRARAAVRAATARATAATADVPPPALAGPDLAARLDGLEAKLAELGSRLAGEIAALAKAQR